MNKVIFNVTGQHLYLVTFADKANDHSFICTMETMAEVIKKYNFTKVKSIKIYDIQKQKFAPLKKDLLRQFSSWETEANLLLESLKLI